MKSDASKKLSYLFFAEAFLAAPRRDPVPIPRHALRCGAYRFEAILEMVILIILGQIKED